MKWIELILICLIILLIGCILFTKIKIRVYKRGTGKGEIDIYLTVIKHLHIDIGKLIRKYLDKYTIDQNIKMVKNFQTVSTINKKIIDKYLKCITVKKIIFIPGYNSTSPLFYPYITLINWQIIGIVKYYLNKFKKVEYEYYQVMMNDETKKGFNLDLLVEIPIRSLIYVTLTNIIATIKLIKSSKGEKESGRKQASNQ